MQGTKFFRFEFCVYLQIEIIQMCNNKYYENKTFERV